VEQLADARLITTQGDERRPEEGVVEVAHEALIRGWSELRRWIDADPRRPADTPQVDGGRAGVGGPWSRRQLPLHRARLAEARSGPIPTAPS
jgi:hypothetical protein